MGRYTEILLRLGQIHRELYDEGITEDRVEQLRDQAKVLKAKLDFHTKGWVTKARVKLKDAQDGDPIHLIYFNAMDSGEVVSYCDSHGLHLIDYETIALGKILSNS